MPGETRGFTSGLIGGQLQMPERISFAEMRAAGMRGIVVCCSNDRCGLWIRLNSDRWADGVRPSDIEPGIVCTACRHRGVNVRPDWQSISWSTVFGLI
jgi:hypothetical protein